MYRVSMFRCGQEQLLWEKAMGCPVLDTGTSIPSNLTVQQIFHSSFFPLTKSISHQFSYMYLHLMCYTFTHIL